MELLNNRVKAWNTFIQEVLSYVRLAQSKPEVCFFYGALKDGYYDNDSDNMQFLGRYVYGKANGMPKLSESDLAKLGQKLDGFAITSMEMICNGEVIKLTVKSIYTALF